MSKKEKREWAARVEAARVELQKEREGYEETVKEEAEWVEWIGGK